MAARKKLNQKAIDAALNYDPLDYLSDEDAADLQEARADLDAATVRIDGLDEMAIRAEHQRAEMALFQSRFVRSAEIPSTLPRETARGEAYSILANVIYRLESQAAYTFAETYKSEPESMIKALRTASTQILTEARDFIEPILEDAGYTMAKMRAMKFRPFFNIAEEYAKLEDVPAGELAEKPEEVIYSDEFSDEALHDKIRNALPHIIDALARAGNEWADRSADIIDDVVRRKWTVKQSGPSKKQRSPSHSSVYTPPKAQERLLLTDPTTRRLFDGGPKRNELLETGRSDFRASKGKTNLYGYVKLDETDLFSDDLFEALIPDDRPIFNAVASICDSREKNGLIKDPEAAKIQITLGELWRTLTNNDKRRIDERAANLIQRSLRRMLVMQGCIVCTEEAEAYGFQWSAEFETVLVGSLHMGTVSGDNALILTLNRIPFPLRYAKVTRKYNTVDRRYTAGGPTQITLPKLNIRDHLASRIQTAYVKNQAQPVVIRTDTLAQKIGVNETDYKKMDAMRKTITQWLNSWQQPDAPDDSRRQFIAGYTTRKKGARIDAYEITLLPALIKKYGTQIKAVKAQNIKKT